MSNFRFLFIAFISVLLTFNVQSQNKKPLRIAVAGLTHTHVHWILGREDIGDIEIVGISEANKDLAKRYVDQHGLDIGIVYDDLETMLAKTKPEAVCAFGSIYEHLEVVEKCAPLGIHVMVEKPLAVNMEHAKKMESLAKKHDIHLLTNYETTWYPTNHYAYDQTVEKGKIGSIKKIVVHDGHEGPKEIGVNQEFLDWLTDPVLNGGGAVIDFGCYGANLITWLQKGKRPQEVFAITQQFKPDVYPKVDDEATIVITYEESQGIIQASWNWPFSRKDMEVYGKTGYIKADNRLEARQRLEGEKAFKSLTFEERPYPYNDPFALFKGVINKEIELKPYDLSSLENNLIVVEILDAAIKSAKTGKAVKF